MLKIRNPVEKTKKQIKTKKEKRKKRKVAGCGCGEAVSFLKLAEWQTGKIIGRGFFENWYQECCRVEQEISSMLHASVELFRVFFFICLFFPFYSHQITSDFF